MTDTNHREYFPAFDDNEVPDNRTEVDIRRWSRTNESAIRRECRLALLNAGGEDGDWYEIAGELETRDFWEVLNEYFTFTEAT